MYYKSHVSVIDKNNLFTSKVEDLIREIIIQNDIPYYRIESGVEHNIRNLVQDTNLPVIRIITYFEDTVSKISHILNDEFDIDFEQSVDKKKIRIETFAYKNIIYIASLKADRQKQTEYIRSGNKKFEIQICSMLQDAWSGIEKELGYENSIMPDEAKRDFYRIGALLEMADIEFLKIRTELSQKKLNKNSASFLQAELIKTQEPKIIATDKNANTSIACPQAVAKEVTKEAPPVQPLPVAAFTTPVLEQPKITATQVAHTPEAKVKETQPFVAAPAPKTTTPVPPSLPIVKQCTIPVNAGVIIVPKPTVIPTLKLPENVITERNNIDIVRFKKIVQNINNVEQENGVVIEVDKHIAKQELQRDIIIPHQDLADTKKTIPTPELTLPVIEKIISIPQTTVIQPGETVIKLSVNGIEIVGKVTEAMCEPIMVKSVSCYNEQSKSTKVIELIENAHMTEATLKEYVRNSLLLKEIDQQIADATGAKINANIDIEGDIERMRFLKVFTLKQLHDRLLDNKKDIVAFAEKWIGQSKNKTFDTGISLFYLEYMLVGKKNDPVFAREYLLKFISDDDYNAQFIISTYNCIFEANSTNYSKRTMVA